MYKFYKGARFQVEFYMTGRGELPAKEYFKEIPLKAQIKLAALVKLIAEEGKIYDEGKYRIVDRQEKIYEFKPLAYRFFNFFHEGGKIIITNGYMKKSQKLDRDELKKAIRIKNDYIDRVRRGAYYEKQA